MRSTWIHAHGPSLFATLNLLGPVRAAFVGSILLSFIAISGSVVPNNDGMLYIEAARLYQDGGFEAVRQLFNWMVLPRSLIGILISTVGGITGLGLETSGYLISTLFLSGACALLVACTRDRMPEAAWAACAVVLTLPALNTYRDYIIREFGAWFFIALALWLVLRWERKPSWSSALGAQISICLAGLFRPESLSLLLAIFLWRLTDLRRPSGMAKLLMMTFIPALGAVVFVFALLFGGGSLVEKSAQIFVLLNPMEKLRLFSEHSDRMANAVLNRWSQGSAGSILMVGLLSLIPAKVISNCGLLVIPLIYACVREKLHSLLTLWGPFFWGAFVFVAVLALFVLERAYLAARYVAPLALMLVPATAVGLHRLYARYPAWRWAIVVVLSVACLANVVSTSPPKSRISDAAAWLRQQSLSEHRVYIEMPEIAYLAGWTFTKARRDLADREAVRNALSDKKIDMALLDDPTSSQNLEDWAKQNNLEIRQKFSDRRKRSVYVITRQPSQR